MALKQYASGASMVLREGRARQPEGHAFLRWVLDSGQIERWREGLQSAEISSSGLPGAVDAIGAARARHTLFVAQLERAAAGPSDFDAQLDDLVKSCRSFTTYFMALKKLSDHFEPDWRPVEAYFDTSDEKIVAAIEALHPTSGPSRPHRHP